MTSILKLKALKPGDTIGIAATARPCDSNLLLKAKQGLQNLGFKIKEASNLREEYGYLAGSDEIRAKALMELFENDEVKAIWCSSGGYGTTRLLDYLDFSTIQNNPKIVLGLSDVTGLHIPLNTLCNMVTFLGPTLSVVYGENYKQSAEAILQSCMEVLLSSEELNFSLSAREDFWILQEGRGSGKLVGGNLALICSLIGTPYSLKTKGTILLLEDVNEPPYKIDRMLQQLKQAKMLDDLSGVILASFKNCEAKTDLSLSLKQVFNHYFSNAKYPVVSGFSSGHIENMLTLPLGNVAILDTASKSLALKNIWANSYSTSI